MDSVKDCYNFFEKGYPNSQPKNFRTQLGVFLEEIGETLDVLNPTSEEDIVLIGLIAQSIKSAGEHFKSTNGEINLKNRVDFLDGICDVMVTCVGVGYHAKMDVFGGFSEVNRSNNSKFGKNGEPILDENLKLIKGPFYTKPDLKSFV